MKSHIPVKGKSGHHRVNEEERWGPCYDGEVCGFILMGIFLVGPIEEKNS